MIVAQKKKLLLPRRKLIGLAAPALLLCAPDDVRAQVIPSWPTPILNSPVVAPSFTTWDSSKKSANITLSGGSLVATLGAGGNGIYNNVASINGITTGEKKFASVTLNAFTSSGDIGLGLGNGTFSWTTANGSNYLGNTNSACWFPNGSGIYVNNSLALSWSIVPAAADIYDIAVDFAAQRAWWRRNGGNWNNSGTANPATNTGGIDISGISGTLYVAVCEARTNDQYTANFGASAWTHAPPSGFTGIS